MTNKIGKNFCIAPFSQLTVSPWGGYSPCPEIGGRPWIDPQVNAVNMWLSDDFSRLRSSFQTDQQDKICDRCWNQESYGNKSLRKRLFSHRDNGVTFATGEVLALVDGAYRNGPKQINVMTSNVCNLRCRTCSSRSSVTYNTEGQYYLEKYKVFSRYIGMEKKPRVFSQESINHITEIGQNLQRLEFYGGEPLLDEPTLDLLEKFVENGRSKEITLFYNTNGTVKPRARQFELWNHFRRLEFNLSIDDIDNRFTYVRHPGQWSDLEANLNDMRTYGWNLPVQFTAICTVSNLNIFYIPEILTRLEQMNLPTFLNAVFSPDYYDIVHLPNTVKAAIIKKLLTFHDLPRVQFLLNMLEQPENLKHWKDFIFWTHAKDQYRQENFADTYPEFYDILHDFDASF